MLQFLLSCFYKGMQLEKIIIAFDHNLVIGNYSCHVFILLILRL
jgi:hypothetical protein